jgi:hypothetical protein
MTLDLRSGHLERLLDPYSHVVAEIPSIEAIEHHQIIDHLCYRFYVIHSLGPSWQSISAGPSL